MIPDISDNKPLVSSCSNTSGCLKILLTFIHFAHVFQLSWGLRLRYSCSHCSGTLLYWDKGPLLFWHITQQNEDLEIIVPCKCGQDERGLHSLASFGMLSKASGIYIYVPGTLNIDSKDTIYHHSTLSLCQAKLNFLFSWQVFLWWCELEGDGKWVEWDEIKGAAESTASFLVFYSFLCLLAFLKY